MHLAAKLRIYCEQQSGGLKYQGAEHRRMIT